MSELEPTTVPIEFDEQAGIERKRRLFNILALSGLITCVVFLVAMFVPPISPWPYIAIFALLLVVCTISLALNRTKYARYAALVWLVSVTLAIFANLVVGILLDLQISSVICYFTLVALASGTVLSPKATFGFSTLSAVLIGILAIIAFNAGSLTTSIMIVTVAMLLS